MRPQSPPASHHLRRRRRILGALPIVVASWAALTGLPFSPAGPRPGKLHTEVVHLTGPDATATPAASGDAGTGPTRRVAPREAAPGWSAAVDVEAGSQAAGITWTGTAGGEVEVRGRTAHGWSEWLHVHASATEGPDGGSANAGDLVWFGADGVDRVEVRVEAGTLRDLTVRAMRYEEPDSGGWGGQVAVAGAADTTPPILPRSSWTSKGWAYSNDDCGNGPKIATGGVTFAVVHHTVNANTYDQDDVAGMLASIYNFHTATPANGGRGWCDIAYNFVIDRFGRIWEARSGGVREAVVGGHAAGYNTGSVGVSFLGQYQEGATPTVAAPTSAALQAAGKLIGWKLGLNGLDPTARTTVTTSSGSRVTIDRVSGHRDVGSTSCPGSLLYSQLATIRSTARATQTATTPTVPSNTTTTTAPSTGRWGPFGSAAALVDQQYVDLLRRRPSANERTFWVESLEGGDWSIGRVISSIAQTDEADDDTNAVIRLYRAYFLRNPDHGGFTYWVGRRDAGWSINRISGQFAGSAEFRNRYGTLDNAGFVDLVYRNVMGRSPDATGRSFWVGRLSAGVPRGEVMAGFSESPEYRGKTRDGVLVIALHEGMLRRAPLQGTYDYLEPRLRTGITDGSGVAWYFFQKPDYAARFR